VDDPNVQALLTASDWKAAFASYRYLDIQHPPPFAPFAKPLREATIAVITSGGLYVRGEQPPFDAADVYGDATIRTFPVTQPSDTLGIAHDHYDHTAPMQDLRTINPAAHLLTLAQEGVIGGLYPTQISFQGYIPVWTRTLERLIPAVLDELGGKPIDGALLVPV
jgi:D-proline reductase (dithiol) PrdB